MNMFAIINPKPEHNTESVLPASTMRVYRSSMSTPPEPLASVTLVEPDGTLAGGLRLDRGQILTVVDTLLSIAGFPDLEEIKAGERRESFDQGFDEGMNFGYAKGYDHGVEVGGDDYLAAL